MFETLQKKGQECRDHVGDRSNCQRFVRCFNNLRVLFTCATGTSYSTKARACLPSNLVTDCNDLKDRIGRFNLILVQNSTKKNKHISIFNIDIAVNPNVNATEDEYPTIEADINALDMSSDKNITARDSATSAPKQFGCGSYCKNQGVCIIVSQSVTCQCPTGYSGIQCQITRMIKKTEIRIIFTI